MSIDISIIIPIYNVEDYIERALDSIARINGRGFKCEVIIVNDGTTDKSDEIAKSYIDKIEDCVFVSQSNQGLSAARNKGLSLAKGEYVFFFDSDDFIDADNFADLFNSGCKKGVDIIIGDYYDFVDGKAKYGRYHLPAKSLTCSGRDAFIKYYEDGINTMVWRSIYRREMLLQNNLLFSNGILHEDINWTPKTLLSAQTVYYSSIPFYYYVQRSGSIQNSSCSKSKIESMLYVCEDLLFWGDVQKDSAVRMKISENVLTNLVIWASDNMLCNLLNSSMIKRIKEIVSRTKIKKISFWTLKKVFLIAPYITMLLISKRNLFHFSLLKRFYAFANK